MTKIKAFFAGILVAVLAAIAFLTGRDELHPKADPYADKQKELEKELAEVEKNGVEAEELTDEEVVDFWSKK